MTALGVSFGAFEVSAEFAEARAVLTVRGELDHFTAPELGALMDAVIDRGHAVVVLDLAECDFIDASGLRVIAAGALRADLWGGNLSIRSPSGVVRRLLDLTSQTSPDGQSSPLEWFGADPGRVLRASEEATVGARTERLGEVLRTRQIIAQAQGVAMERDCVDEDDAYTMLRRFSTRTGRPLRERAEDVVASTRRPLSRLPVASGPLPPEVHYG